MDKPKKVLYFDCFAGASGDMIIGSLLDLGLDLKMLETELAKLSLAGYRIDARKVVKSGFSATKFDVLNEDGHRHDCAHEQEGHDHGHHHGHGHEHRHHSGHEHNHEHEHGHDHSRGHHHHHGEQRNLDDIIRLIQQSQLAPEIKEKSSAVFNRLAVAEAKIHGTVPEKIHFHEVGAVDAIVDIVGAVIGLHLLQIEKIVVSPLPMGKGFVRCQHGTIPVPAPATMELLTGMTTYGSEHNGETVTPTGAAILSTLAGACGPMPALNVVKVGYGAGTRDFGVPNLLRAVLGEEKAAVPAGLDCHTETVMELEANIDDMNPEFFEYIFEQLFAGGALDVFLVPIQMKKNRPASILRVQCAEKDLYNLAGVLFRETSTIGLRMNRWKRLCLEREIVQVETEYGAIRIKQALLDGNVVNSAPEYEDCKEKAKAHGVPLKKVYQAAMRAGEV